MYTRPQKPRITPHGYLRFELFAFNENNEGIVLCVVKNVTFESASFRVNRRQTRALLGLLQQV